MQIEDGDLYMYIEELVPNVNLETTEIEFEGLISGNLFYPGW